MKTLILVRHAKSDWSHEGLGDIERPLNERGRKDAPDMAKRLHKKGLKIDLFLSSPAKRAFRTARFFAEEFDIKKDAIQVENRLYGAMPHQFEDVIADINHKEDIVAVFSHNPGITEYANTLCEVRTDNIPTCG
ncbi:MAG: histidine phosphatase family protein, partial [Moraxellaceae bacterium]